MSPELQIAVAFYIAVFCVCAAIAKHNNRGK